MSRSSEPVQADPKTTAEATVRPVEVAASCDLAVCTRRLQNSEDLREATRGADLRIVQLAPGPFEGQLTRAQICGLSVSAGDFERDIRARGVMNREQLTLGMMIESSGEVGQWDYEVLPGDVVVFPKSVEQEGRFTGRSRYLTLTLDEEELALHCAGEQMLSDARFWTRPARYRSSPGVRDFIRRNLNQKIAQLRQGVVPQSRPALQYLRKTLLETFILGVLDQQDKVDDRRNGARLVRAVEDYVDSVRSDDVMHISELCIALRVSRRTLHRGFHETLGTGPMDYLRLRRLAEAHKALSDAAAPSVTQCAFDAGFSDLGRFAGYYRRLYGECPSETRRRVEGTSV